MNLLRAFLFGLIFGGGLVLSGMTDPARVIGFLDWAGNWDPSLAFVMGGAVITAAPFFAIARRRGQPLAAETLDQPASTEVDGRLVGGAALFGIGWGMVGVCPGPAFVLFGQDPRPIALFLAVMLLGLAFSTWLSNKYDARVSEARCC